ncbi:unnamed protein product [Caenorhabditis brenneri]
MMHFKFVVLMIIPMIACEHHYVQDHDDNLLNRFERAAQVTKIPVKTPSKPPINTPAKTPGKTATAAPVNSQKKSTIPEVVQRHMMLGRTFNALYLQNQLANNKIDYSDVIAGVWNLKDKTVIDKISSLKVDGLSESLAKLDANIKADSSGAMKIADVGELEEKMKFLSQITDKMKNDLLASTNQDLLPEYAVSVKSVGTLESNMENIKEDLTLKALEIVKLLMRSSNNFRNNAIDAGNLVSKSSAVLKDLPTLIREAVANSGSFDALVKGIEVADSLKTKNQDFTALSTLLRDAGTALEQIKKLGDGVGLDKVQQSVGELNTILPTLGQKSSVVPIGIAFLKDRNLSRIEADWQTQWMRTLLHNGTTLSPLSNAIPNFKDLAQKFQPINNNMSAWFEVGASERMSHVSQLIEQVLKVSANTGMANLDNLASCLSIPKEGDYSVLSEVRNIATSSTVIRQRLTDIKALLDKGEDGKSAISALAEVKTKLTAVELMNKDDFESYMNTSSGGTGQADLTKMMATLTDLSKKWFSQLKGDDKFKEAVENMKNGKDNVMKSLTILSGINIAKPECNSLFSFKPAELNNLNDAPQLITLVKTHSDIGHLKPLVDTVPKVSAGLKQLKSPTTPPSSVTQKPLPKPAVTQKPVTKPPSKKPKRETKAHDDESPPEFETKNPQNLLDAASSFRSLEVMEEIHRSDKAIETILKRGEIAKKKVESDPELTKKFGDVWKGFDGLKATLTTLQAGIKKALAKIPLTGDGGSFEEIRQVYTSISTSPITTTPIQLQDYRRSLMEFPDSGSWKDLEEAFAKLERPVSTDFKLSYAGFSKMPQVLKSLEDELEKFFQSQGNDKKGGRKPTFWEANGLYFFIGGGVLLLLIMAAIGGFLYWCMCVRDPDRNKKLEDDKFSVKSVGTLESNMENIKEDLTLKALEIVKLLMRSSNNFRNNAIDAGNLVSKSSAVLKDLPTLIREAVANSGSFDALVKGIEVADSLKTKNQDFTALSTLLRDAGTALEQIKKLGDGVGLDKVQQSVGELNTILPTLGQKSSVVPIGIAFLKDRNLSRIEADWQTQWMRTLLHNGTTLSPLSNAIPNFKDLAQKFQPINNNMSAWFEVGASERMSHVSQLIEQVLKVSANTGMANLDNLASCLSIPKEGDYSVLSEVRNIATSSTVIRQRLTDIKALLDKGEDGKSAISALAEVKTKLTAVELMNKDDFESYMNTSSGGTGQADLTKMMATLTDLSKKWFSQLKGDDKFKEAVENMKNGKDNVMKSLTILSGINIAKPECNSLFSFKPAELNNLNDAPQLITLVKTHSDIGHLKPLVDTVPKVSAGLKQLKSPTTPPSSVTQKPLPKPAVTQKPVTKPPSKKPKRETKAHDDESPPEFETKNPQNLLDAASSFRSLEVMEEIHRSDKAIETILKRGEIAKKKVESDPELTKKFGDVWKGFDGLKATLTTLQAGIKKALAKIPLTGDGGSFEEIRQVYTSISTSPITTTPIQLQDYRRSLMEFPDSGSWKDLEEAFAKLERPVSTDFKLSYAGFSKMPQVLKSLEDELEKFFQSQGNDKKGGRKPTFWEANGLYFFIGGGVLLLLIMAAIGGFLYWCMCVRDPDRNKKLEDDKLYDPDDRAYTYWTYLQLQDSRLPMNKRDKDGNTPIFNALARRDWEAVHQYLEAGVILDATCNGSQHRTMLYELVLMKEPKWCKRLFEAGADKEITDATGDSADIWADDLGQADLFNEYHALWKKGNQPWRTLPSIPRPWNILVFDNKQFPKRKRRKLPLRIKRNTKWGYKPGMDLNEFTHIIVPDNMEYDENTLKMSDDNLMTFKLLGCAANLVSVDWFYRLTDYPKDAKKYMDEDYDCYLLNTHYNGQTHKDAAYNLKTRIHRMLPPLLSEVKIRFLPTKDKKALKEQAEWKEIITLFGGTCPDKMTGDTYWEAGPYWSMEWDYVHEYRDRQNKPWILYYPDSDTTKREWQKERVEGKTGRWTVAPFRFLPECLARNFLLGMAQKIVPVVEDEVFGDDSEGQHLENSVTSVSTTSTTTDAGKTPITTGANNNVTAATATQSVSGASTTSTVGDAAPTQSKIEQAKRTRNRLLQGRDIVKGANGRKVISRESANQVQPPTSKFGASKEPAHAPDAVRKNKFSKSKMSAEPPTNRQALPTSRMLPPARIAPEK